MAKKKDKTNLGDFTKEYPVTEQIITDTLETNYMPYAMSVIYSRALPEIDGFKPSHRKLLYTMYKKGLLHSQRTKSANVVGETMKLNPHGDQAIYDTMARMARGNETLLHPLVDSKGNFGKRYSRDMACAASRYTEVKLSKICEELFKDIDKETVDFVDNYDGTMKEPTLLPVTFPTILVNSNQGVAVGMATNICSFNLAEVCRATCAYIEDKNANLLEYIKAPDFSTGGTAVFKESEMINILENGRGTIKVRSKWRFDKKAGYIEIYEIPYTTTLEVIIDNIIDLVKAGKIKDISDVRDETDKEGLKIAIELKRGTDPEDVMNRLYSLKVPIQDSFSCNFNVLVKGRPVVLGVRGLIAEWLDFRVGCVKRELQHDIKAKSDKLHLLRGLSKILLDIDKAVKIIRETEKEELVVPNLMWGFGIDEIQANYVADIKLRNLNKEYLLKRTSESDNLKDEIEDMQLTLSSERRILTVIKKQLKEIEKKYGQERKTDIMEEQDVVVIAKEEFIEDYNLKLILTRESYFKKIPLTALRASPDQKLKEGDEIVQEVDWHNKSEIVMVSDMCNVYKMKIHDMPEARAAAMGEYLPNLLEMEPGEKIVYFVPADNYDGMMLYAFKNGKVAKIPFNCYETKNNRKKLIKAYADKSPLIDALFIKEDTDIGMVAENDKILVVNTALIPLKTTKNTQGVQVMKFKKNVFLKTMKKATDLSVANAANYRQRNIPSSGSAPKKEDASVQQLTMI